MPGITVAYVASWVVDGKTTEAIPDESSGAELPVRERSTVLLSVAVRWRHSETHQDRA